MKAFGLPDKPVVKKTINLHFEETVFVLERENTRNSTLVAIRDFSEKKQVIAGARLDNHQVEELIQGLKQILPGGDGA